MLEESKMDKKPSNRSSQQSRASAIDCKKSAELSHKPWPRGNKKREGPNGPTKNELNRKNSTSQRGRGFVDKRPRTRENLANATVGGEEKTRLVNDDEPEIGSVFVPGSKKQNLNHLLNFMYPSRGGSDRRGPPAKRQQCISYHHVQDLYLRAYCQFVVQESGDYKNNILDPDLPMKWENIEEIVVRSTGKSECPICLGTPVAGRVGLCGHVYCWACVLHYADSHEKQPPPCPVCSTALHVKDMKPTIMLQWEPPAEEVTMRLVRRLRGSTVVEIAPPRGQTMEGEAAEILPLENIKHAPYNKLFAASKQQVLDILLRERKEIQDQILAEIDTTELVYLEQALKMLEIKEEAIHCLSTYESKTDKMIKSIPTTFEKLQVNQNKVDWFDVTDEGAACIEVVMPLQGSETASSFLNPEAPEFKQCDINVNEPEEFPLTDYNLDNKIDVTEVDKQNQAKYFYFYQANDGQQVFLSSLNIRLLSASWGVLATAPPVIQGRVLHRETLSLNDQMRKHMPYTAHLPLHCAFDVVELDLKPPHVTISALKNFSDELDRHARARARQEREERRRERAYRRTIEGPPKPDFSSEALFPAPSHYSPPVEFSPLSDDLLQPNSLCGPQPSDHVSPNSPGLSFAKMASTSGTWRVRKPSTALVNKVEPVKEDTEAESEGAPRALCLSDAIEAALHAAPVTSPHTRKNKKTKPKVLFATGMQYAA